MERREHGLFEAGAPRFRAVLVGGQPPAAGGVRGEEGLDGAEAFQEGALALMEADLLSN